MTELNLTLDVSSTPFCSTEKLEDVQGFCFKVYLDTQEERLAICVPHPGE